MGEDDKKDWSQRKMIRRYQENGNGDYIYTNPFVKGNKYTLRQNGMTFTGTYDGISDQDNNLVNFKGADGHVTQMNIRDLGEEGTYDIYDYDKDYDKYDDGWWDDDNNRGYTAVDVADRKRIERSSSGQPNLPIHVANDGTVTIGEANPNTTDTPQSSIESTVTNPSKPIKMQSARGSRRPVQMPDVPKGAAGSVAEKTRTPEAIFNTPIISKSPLSDHIKKRQLSPDSIVNRVPPTPSSLPNQAQRDKEITTDQTMATPTIEKIPSTSTTSQTTPTTPTTTTKPSTSMPITEQWAQVLGKTPEEKATEEAQLKRAAQKKEMWGHFFDGLRYLGQAAGVAQGGKVAPMSDTGSYFANQYKQDKTDRDALDTSSAAYRIKLYELQQQEKQRQKELEELKRTHDRQDRQDQMTQEEHEAKMEYYGARTDKTKSDQENNTKKTEYAVNKPYYNPKTGKTTTHKGTKGKGTAWDQLESWANQHDVELNWDKVKNPSRELAKRKQEWAKSHPSTKKKTSKTGKTGSNTQPNDLHVLK